MMKIEETPLKMTCAASTQFFRDNPMIYFFINNNHTIMMDDNILNITLIWL